VNRAVKGQFFRLCLVLIQINHTLLPRGSDI
jgi:hypothetical protein